MRKFLTLPALLTLAALPRCSCDEAGVQPMRASIEVSPEVLDLGEIPIGVTARGVITVRNAGDAPLTVSAMQIDLSSLFAFEGNHSLILAARTSEARSITMKPEALGDFEATLRISSDDIDRPELTVKLRAKGVEPPPCDDGNVCTSDAFDTGTASCVHEFADGTACQPADRCIVGAICSQGVCLGSAKVCQDDSICTRDLCRQIDGECVYISDEDACDDDNPCTADGCDLNGCFHEPVPSGSPCDDNDACTSGDACFAGLCSGTGAPDGSACDDGNSCTEGDLCTGGRCVGGSILDARPESEIIFSYNLSDWNGAFLHRREVSLSDDGVLYSMDHLPLYNPPGLNHLIFTMSQCGTPGFEFSYRPPDTHVFVSYVRREMQLEPDNSLRIVVGIRQTRDQGYLPQTTTYLLDPEGNVERSQIQVVGGETGRSLLPDGSHIFGVVWPLSGQPLGQDEPALQNLVIVREDRDGNILWRHERTSGDWAEFLGTAGPRVLFWANRSWGALDFNTGQLVWSSPTVFIADQMALSTGLNLGLARVGVTTAFGIPSPTQLIGVEILEGRQVFAFPAEEDPGYIPRTDPVIAADGRIILLMQRSILEEGQARGTGLDFVELTADGALISTTPLPYEFPADWGTTRSRDWGDDPFPTVADDGVTYVGYGDRFWAIDPGGQIRWTLTSTMPDAFTATVPLLREDGVLLINEGSRRMLGVKTNGGQMSQQGWASFRHDNRRTNYTP
jgi:hypothetical protein